MQGRKLDQILDDQFATGRLYAAIASRPGQVRAAVDLASPSSRRFELPAAPPAEPPTGEAAALPTAVARLPATALHAPGPAVVNDVAIRLSTPLTWLSAARMQCGRADGYILEGRELEFYVKKMQKKKVGGGARGGLVSSWVLFVSHGSDVTAI